jgi:hypothetical protein
LQMMMRIAAALCAPASQRSSPSSRRLRDGESDLCFWPTNLSALAGFFFFLAANAGHV